ncbi:outer membrane lipoprotein LolB [Sinobacterium caligoides]|uniref:Outer-membrane lipoprotein LolB n=1 Tax=Sinobacterium caligoides TaxID=933926 RepID=A0A3N2E178_9GAMM|nr:lipoprotein insertase outer membrane protein LolB [Sinobacterium caligoides]ROS05777.1 outer membrane lipoprotein LolB [Sinobacterium caligoides]
MRPLLPCLLLILLLSGCVSGPAFKPGFEQPKDPLNDWTLRGRLGIRTADNAESASLYWRQTGEAYKIKLSGPFGAGSIAIDGTPLHVELRQHGHETLQADNAEQLIYQQTGWRLPVSSMHYWVQGLASPELSVDDSRRHTGTGIDNKGAQQPLAMLRQQDWLIEYQRYSLVGDILLPSKIVITHPELRLTLIINEWQPHQAGIETQLTVSLSTP